MNRPSTRNKQIIFIASCGLLLAALAAAQTFPLGYAQPRAEAAVQSAAGAAPSPTPASAPPHVPAASPSARRRDAARYEQAGKFSVHAAASPQDREAVIGRARAFLLDHWRGRRAGHVVLEREDADGHWSPSSFYVEPDEAGRWSVVLETADGEQKFRFVEEVEAPEDGPPLLSPASEGAPQGSGVMRLHLKESADAKSGLIL